jgi:hypothetical protein
LVGLAYALNPVAQPSPASGMRGGLTRSLRRARRGGVGNHGDMVSNHDKPDSPPAERDRDDEVPETPPTEPSPIPVEEPPAPGPSGPYVVGA